MSHPSNAPNDRTGGVKLPPWLVIVIVVTFLGVAWYQNRQTDDVAQPDIPSARQPSGAKGAVSREPANEPTTDSPSAASRNDRDGDQPVLPEVTPERDNATSRESPSRSGTTSDDKTTTDRSPQQTRARPGTSITNRTSPDQRTNPKSPSQPTNDPRKPDSAKQGQVATATLENQTIKDFGRVVYRGTIDLQPTLDRIARGEKNSHRNDGSTFGNRERRLPQKPTGYYTEYVHPTKGINGPGPQRVISGKGGEIWYTPDHYETFKKIK